MSQSLATSAAVPDELKRFYTVLCEFGSDVAVWSRRLASYERTANSATGSRVLANLSVDIAVSVARTAQAFLDADTSVSNLVSAAEGQVGYREKSNNDTKFGRWYGANNQPWCAMFVSWAFAQAGIPLPAIQSAKGFAAVRTAFDWAMANRRLSTVPRPGDIFLISHGGGLGHTGIVKSVNADGTITTIEGNTNADGSRNGNGVYERTRPVASINAGFLRVEGEVPVTEQWAGPTDFTKIGRKRRSTRRKNGSTRSRRTSAKLSNSARKRAR